MSRRQHVCTVPQGVTPDVEVEVSPPRRPGRPWLALLPRCPFCGSQHHHGAGLEGAALGLRVAHCGEAGARRSYRLVAAAPVRRAA